MTLATMNDKTTSDVNQQQQQPAFTIIGLHQVRYTFCFVVWFWWSILVWLFFLLNCSGRVHSGSGNESAWCPFVCLSVCLSVCPIAAYNQTHSAVALNVASVGLYFFPLFRGLAMNFCPKHRPSQATTYFTLRLNRRHGLPLLSAKFHKNRPNSFTYIAIFTIFKMAAVCHLGFSKFQIFSSWWGWESQYATDFIKNGRMVLELSFLTFFGRPYYRPSLWYTVSSVCLSVVCL